MAEDVFLKPNYYLGVVFSQGPVFFRITGREIIRYEPYEVGSLSPGQSITDIVPKDDYYDQRILEPEMDRYILHSLVGVAPEPVEVYLEFPPRNARYSIFATRRVGGPQKWIDGMTSPFDNPNPDSELISFRDLYPAFDIYNPSDETVYAMMSFKVAKYTYRIVDNANRLEALMDGRKTCKIYDFLEPYTAPNWLITMLNRIEVDGVPYLQFTRKMWDELMGRR